MKYIASFLIVWSPINTSPSIPLASVIGESSETTMCECGAYHVRVGAIFMIKNVQSCRLVFQKNLWSFSPLATHAISSSNTLHVIIRKTGSFFITLTYRNGEKAIYRVHSIDRPTHKSQELQYLDDLPFLMNADL